MKVKIITDSTNDLTKDILDKYEIDVVPLSVAFGEKAYLDGVEIITSELYEKVEQEKQLPKTAAVPIHSFIEIFEKYVNEGYEIVYTGISKSLSRTFENAYLAAQEVGPDKIHVVDSMNLSTGTGLLLLKAVKYREQGLGAAEIAAKLEQDRNRVLSQFAIETMDYLHKGGRCSGVTRFVGSLLKLKPIIQVREGKMGVGKLPRGKMVIALNVLVSQLQEDLPRLDKDVVIITHSLADESCAYLQGKLQEVLGSEVPVITTQAGCVISSHCGKGTIGILYMINEE